MYPVYSAYISTTLIMNAQYILHLSQNIFSSIIWDGLFRRNNYFSFNKKLTLHLLKREWYNMILHAFLKNVANYDYWESEFH